MKYLSLLLFLYALLILFSGGEIHAQVYKLKHLGVEDGLPSSEAYCLTQDSKGYIWIGTDRGAAKYDGQSFQVMGLKDGLQNEVVFQMAADQKGCIWFATYAPTLSYWDGEAICQYEYNDAFFREQPYESIKSKLMVKPDNSVYLASYEYGLIQANAEGEVNHCSPFYRSECTNIEGEPVFYSRIMFTESRVDSFLLIEYGANGFEVDRSRGERNLLYSQCVAGRDSTLYLAINNDLYAIKQGQILWHKNLLTSIVTLTIDSQGTLWVGIRQGGVKVFTSTGQPVFSEFPDLTGKTVSAIFQDDEGGYWFATAGDGVYYSTALFFPMLSKATYPKSERISDFALVSDSLLFIGYTGGVVSALTVPQNNRWEIKASQPTNDVPKISLSYDPVSNRVWAGNNQLWEFNPEDLSGKNLIGQNIWGQIYSIEQGQEDTLWIGTNRGLVYYAGTFPIRPPYDPPQARVFCVKSDSKGRLWKGDLKGLWTRKGQNWVRPLPHSPLLKQRITDLAFLPSGDLLCGTGGSGIIHLSGEQIKLYQTQDGLLSNVVNSIDVDEAGIIWVGGSRGLQRIELRDSLPPIIRAFDQRHGMPFVEISRVRAGKERIWFSGPGGISFLTLGNLPQPSPPPRVQIKGILADGKLCSPKEATNLPSQTNSVSVFFESLHFRALGRIQYRYRVPQLESEWRYTYDKRVTYAGLQPGIYTLEIAAPNEDGIWGERTRVPFRIEIPLTQKLSFQLFLAVFILLTTFGIGLYFFRQWQQRAMRETAIKEWKYKALQARMNPHFTFNTLNTIQAYITTYKVEAAEKYLNKFSNLMRKVLQQSAEPKVSLEEEISLLSLYLDLQQMRYSDSFSYYLKVQPPLSPTDAFLPPMMVQPFVENAILHGLVPKTKIGNLTITYSDAGSHIYCTIVDDGIGREAAKKRKQRKKSAYKSIGIGLVSEQLKILSPKRRQNVEIIDLFDEEGQPVGTRVVLWIPKL